MTKQRDIFKGRVKRLLKDQEDMGQVGEPAVQSCVDYSRLCANLRTVVLALCAKKVAAIEAFVHDLGKKLKAQAELQGENAAITPVELKQVVMAHPEFAFLQEKVASIDESDAKYHKSHTRKKKATAVPVAVAKPTKKRTTAATSTNGAKEKKATKKAPTKAKKAKTAAAGAAEETADKATVAGATVLPSSVKMAQKIEIEEDDDYDESDSE